MVLTKRTCRHMSNVKDFCDFDTERKTATLHLNYKNVEEIIDGRLSTECEPVVCVGAIEALEEYLEYVPKEFKVNFQIKIEDCEGYEPQKLEESYNKTMAIRDVTEKVNYSNNQSKMGIFVVVGLIMLLFVIFNGQNKWFEGVGLPLSATIAFVLELFFELYFESGLTHFVITKVYERFENEERFGAISII